METTLQATKERIDNMMTITTEEYEYLIAELKLTITAGSEKPVKTQALLLNTKYSARELLNILAAELRQSRREVKELREKISKLTRTVPEAPYFTTGLMVVNFLVVLSHSLMPHLDSAVLTHTFPFSTSVYGRD